MSFSKFSNEEIERRRLASIETMKVRDRKEFDIWYQKVCDTLYWTKGRCCAGCDFWSSDMGLWGKCQHAGIVDGHQALASMGIRWHTYHNPPPDYPSTRAKHVCENFKDDFDWSTLENDYLISIGAKYAGTLQPKPQKLLEPGQP